MSSRRDETELPEVVLTRRREADPEVVYYVVVDLETHLEWAGRRQWRSHGLESIDAPAGLASVGRSSPAPGGSGRDVQRSLRRHRSASAGGVRVRDRSLAVPKARRPATA